MKRIDELTVNDNLYSIWEGYIKEWKIVELNNTRIILIHNGQKIYLPMLGAGEYCINTYNGLEGMFWSNLCDPINAIKEIIKI